jgi:hypothetical protein
MAWLGTADNRSTPSLVGQASGAFVCSWRAPGPWRRRGTHPETVLIAEKGKPWLPQ